MEQPSLFLDLANSAGTLGLVLLAAIAFFWIGLAIQWFVDLVLGEMEL